MKILLIEPDRALAKTYMESLQQVGHHVQVAATAQGAIQAADAQTPDVVILELQLVGHSGVEFLYEFRSYTDWQHIPVIVQSGIPATEFTSQWQLLQQSLGVSTYLYKPYTSLRQLQAQLNELVLT